MSALSDGAKAAILKQIGLLEDAADNVRTGLAQGYLDEAGLAADEALELAAQIARAIPDPEAVTG